MNKKYFHQLIQLKNWEIAALLKAGHKKAFVTRQIRVDRRNDKSKTFYSAKEMKWLINQKLSLETSEQTV